MPENIVEKSSGVIVIGDGGQYVNLGFVVPGSIFFNNWEDAENDSELSSLVIIDKNVERTISKSKQALDRGVKQVTIVWNPEFNQFYSYSMISVAGWAKYCAIRIVGSTARLRLSNSLEALEARASTPEEIRSSLIEQLRQPVNVSVNNLNSLVKAQNDLLKLLESLALSEGKSRLELQVLRKRNAQLPELHVQLKELKSENSRLRRRNDALARKALKNLK